VVPQRTQLADTGELFRASGDDGAGSRPWGRRQRPGWERSQA